MAHENEKSRTNRRAIAWSAGVVVLLAAVGVLAAYGSNAFGSGGGADDGRQLAIGSADNGGLVRARAGDTLRLVLDENPTTGYSWALELSRGLTLKSDQYKPDTVPSGVVGSGGRHVWIIEVTGSGDQTIRAAYVRPWSPQDAAERFTLSVVVD